MFFILQPNSRLPSLPVRRRRGSTLQGAGHVIVSLQSPTSHKCFKAVCSQHVHAVLTAFSVVHFPGSRQRILGKVFVSCAGVCTCGVCLSLSLRSSNSCAKLCRMQLHLFFWAPAAAVCPAMRLLLLF